MAKHKPDNQRIKRKYLLWLKDARGLSDASIDKAAAAISTYADWLGARDFRAFHAECARSFKRHLLSLKNARTSAPLSAATTNSTLRELKGFFYWLADQQGYKSRISRSDADYLTPDRKSETARRGSLWKPHPSPDQARHVVSEMPTRSVIERRNRALVAFLFLTASREGAAISLQIGHVDLSNACVQFDGRSVHTKFGKSFTTSFSLFETVVADWITELKSEHLFSATDPLFPKTKVGLGPSGKFEPLGIERRVISYQASNNRYATR